MPRLSIRVDLDEDRRIGPGKIELLENIQAHGSISAGGRAMRMSYKKAWDLVDEIGQMCGKPVVTPHAGGARGGGATLTPFGLSLIRRYRDLEQAAMNAAKPHLRSLQRDIARR